MVYVKHLWLQNFRNYDEIDISLPKGKVLLLGDNGQGKSNFIEAYSNLGMVLFKSRKLDKAEKILKQAIILNSNYYGLYTNLGNVFKELGKLKEAKSCYEKAISLNPNHAESYTNLGNIFKEFRKFPLSSWFLACSRISMDSGSIFFPLFFFFKFSIIFSTLP